MKKVYALYLTSFEKVILFKLFSSRYKCNNYISIICETHEVPLYITHISENEGYLKELSNDIDIFKFKIEEIKVN